MTAPTPLATPQDVSAFLNRPLPENDGVTVQVGRWLASISATIRRRRPTIDADLAAGLLDADEVKGTLSWVIGRILTATGRGVGVRREQYPEWSYELEQAAAAAMRLTADEWDTLTVAPPTLGGAYSIQLC